MVMFTFSWSKLVQKLSEVVSLSWIYLFIFGIENYITYIKAKLKKIKLNYNHARANEILK